MKFGSREPDPVMGMSLSLALLINSMALASNPHGPVVVAGDASQTLLEFSRKSSIQILYLSKDVEGVATQQLDGTLEAHQALQAMLSITRLKVRFVGPRSAVVTPDSAPPTSAQAVVSKRRRQKFPLPGTSQQVAGAAPSSLEDLPRTDTLRLGGLCDDGLDPSTRQGRSNSTLGCEINWHGLGATVPMPEFRYQESLPANRRTNGTSDSTPWGGANFDSPPGAPGNIIVGNVHIKNGTSTGLLATRQLSLAIDNLFDRDPPFVNNQLGVGFDPTNANPSGRQLILQVIKRI